MPKVIERQSQQSVPITSYYPRIIGGSCEFHGTMDSTKPATVQYTLCDHFKDLGEMRCSYCDATKNPEEVIYKSTLNIHGHPYKPNELVVVCDNFTCAQKHEARFKLSI